MMILASAAGALTRDPTEIRPLLCLALYIIRDRTKHGSEFVVRGLELRLTKLISQRSYKTFINEEPIFKTLLRWAGFELLTYTERLYNSLAMP